jgi:hypothetical protein
MYTDLFPSRIFKYHLDLPDLRQNMLDRYNSWSNHSSNETPDGWSCDCRTEFQGAFPLENRDHYTQILREWSREMGLLDRPYIDEIWMNAYEQQQFQESHTHLPGFFSGIHYIMFDSEEHEATTFQNPQDNIHSFMFDESFLDKDINEYLHENHTPKVVEGDIILFPSHLKHFVKRNNSKKLRMTISFNINRIAESTRRVFA